MLDQTPRLTGFSRIPADGILAHRLSSGKPIVAGVRDSGARGIEHGRRLADDGDTTVALTGAIAREG
jgi:hypothetical protein